MQPMPGLLRSTASSRRVSLRGKRNCPRCAFLGLCGEGLVKGIPSGPYTRSKLNKRYAVDAVLLLSGRTALADDPRQLWQLVIGGAPKVENAQMDVVVALWKRGLIV